MMYICVFYFKIWQQFMIKFEKFELYQSTCQAHGEVYSIQHYVIKFVSDLRQVGGFLWVLRFSLQIKLTIMI
jgi:hypothetical protein